ncbi:hypothetical protein DPX16_8448 [Anabarilius grahami]|uniref:Uncharacterized protein n=1 Tax=Anabarilius grahami TaxID=495550 RepID=A0A3N0Z2Y8_ANAGA|nr:hypothetical protein DPX16_8448 [Anabarilius grahami]
MKGLMGRNLCPWTNKKTYPSANGTVQFDSASDIEVNVSETDNNVEEDPDYEASSSDEHETPSVEPSVVSQPQADTLPSKNVQKRRAGGGLRGGRRVGTWEKHRNQGGDDGRRRQGGIPKQEPHDESPRWSRGREGTWQMEHGGLPIETKLMVKETQAEPKELKSPSDTEGPGD